MNEREYLETQLVNKRSTGPNSDAKQKINYILFPFHSIYLPIWIKRNSVVILTRIHAVCWRSDGGIRSHLVYWECIYWNAHRNGNNNNNKKHSHCKKIFDSARMCDRRGAYHSNYIFEMIWFEYLNVLTKLKSRLKIPLKFGVNVCENMNAKPLFIFVMCVSYGNFILLKMFSISYRNQTLLIAFDAIV